MKLGDGPELPANVFKILRDLIHERTGMHYDDAKRELLADKLSSRIADRGFNSYLDYYYLLKYGPNEGDEWPRVIDALSVQETYFWREMGQIHALVDHILPNVLPKDDSPVRIWCAACATGEEPLTLAMALNEAGWFERVRIEILASDASPAAIRKAERGQYRERSFRALPVPLREKYFIGSNGVWQIDAGIHSHIRWSLANLVNGSQFASLARVPLIFCRNVFIYFTDETITRTISQFAESMQRPGYLFVGASESLLKLTDEFELEQIGDAFSYVLK